MIRRSGFTLVEVLVAIFVMAIGMIALLTLFPIGVLQMAQSIRQDKCLRAAITAESVANITNVRSDPVVIGLPVGDLFIQPVGYMKAANPYGASYAVMVDPHGYLAANAVVNARSWVGGVAPVGAGVSTGGLLRRPTSFTGGLGGSLPLIKQWFSLPDEVVFDNAMPTVPPSNIPGTPKLAAPGTMMRETQFTWTYVLQRPRSADPSIVNCTVVVFQNRPLVLANTGVTLALPEYFYGARTGATVTFNLLKNTITIAGANPAPPTRPGDWLYDATILLPGGNTGFPEIASAFYRVVAVDQINANTYQYQVQQPLRPMTQDPGMKLVPPQRTRPGTVIALDGVSEVFERGPARLP